MSPVCGSCTACCKILAVEPLQKPAGQWCKHCDIGKGCKIYLDRPEPCHAFECLWLQHDEMPDAARPDHCKVVFSVTDPPEGVKQAIIAHVDPGRPDAYKQGFPNAVIAKSLREGLDVYLVIGEKRKYVSAAKFAALRSKFL
jgi:hypothetical protein